MTYLVYHFDMEKYANLFGSWREIKGREVSGECDGPAFPEEYTAVAAVEADGIEDVFRLTNHIDSDWTDNEEVLPFVPQARSTSMGDVVVGSDKKRLLCAAVGWEEI